ncbi:MAG: ROK family protein [Ferruginibacter sp.]
MRHTIAIDLGGTIIKIGLLKNGHLIERAELKAIVSSGLKPQLAPIEKSVNQLLTNSSLGTADLMGIGFSFAGLVNSSINKIISTNQKYDDGPEIDLVGWAREKWNSPLFAENDARMALLGEWKRGAGKICNDLVMVTLGTGIGSAVLIDGQLLKGKHFQAGNLGGHFTINYQGSTCTCGNIGCVESEASTWRLPSLIKEHPGFNNSSLSREPLLDFNALFLNAKNDDVLAKEILAHCLSVWSAGIISMIHAYDPELVILSGGIMKSASMFLPALQENVYQRAWTPWGKVKLVAANYPDDAALYGADYLVGQQLMKPTDIIHQ